MRHLQGKNRRALISLLSLMVVVFSGMLAHPISAADHPILYLFWGEGCPDCEEEKGFLQELQKNYPQLELRWFDIGNRPEFVELATLLCQAYDIKAASVPLTFLGNWGHIGFQQRETTGSQIAAQVEICVQQGCRDALDTLGPRQIVLNIRNEAALNIPAGWELYPLVGRQPSASPTAQRTDKVIVYYLHGRARCASCLTIEKYTRETVRDAFANELKTGLLELKIVNVETPENKHFIKDYQIYSQSVVVSEVNQEKEIRWKNLQKIWELLYNEEAFKKYIQLEIAKYLWEEQS